MEKQSDYTTSVPLEPVGSIRVKVVDGGTLEPLPYDFDDESAISDAGDFWRTPVTIESNTTNRDHTAVLHGGRAPTAPLPTHRACPFCNCVAGLIPYQDYGVMKYRIGCDTCDTQSGLYPTEAQAWHAWDMRGGVTMFTAEDNKRPEAADVTALLDDIEKAWGDQEIADQLDDRGRLYPGQEEMFRTEAVERMKPFRLRLAVLVGRGGRE